MIKSAISYFIVILIGSLVASFAGGGFALLIAKISPELVSSLLSLKPSDGSVYGYAFSVGMLWGLFIGVGTACFTCGLSALVQIIKLRIEHKTT